MSKFKVGLSMFEQVCRGLSRFEGLNHLQLYPVGLFWGSAKRFEQIRTTEPPQLYPIGLIRASSKRFKHIERTELPSHLFCRAGFNKFERGSSRFEQVWRASSRFERLNHLQIYCVGLIRGSLKWFKQVQESSKEIKQVWRTERRSTLSCRLGWSKFEEVRAGSKDWTTFNSIL